MEMLSQKIEAKVKDKKWMPDNISKKGSGISHLFFDDDLVLMSRADKHYATSIIKSFMNFVNNLASP